MEKSKQHFHRKYILAPNIGKKFMSRVQQAKLAILKLAGKVFEGSASYRSVTPKGAGHHPDVTRMEDRISRGARQGHRMSVNFIKKFHPDWFKFSGRRFERSVRDLYLRRAA